MANKFSNKSSSQINAMMMNHVRQAGVLSRRAAINARLANELLAELKARKIAVVEVINSTINLDTAPVLRYESDGKTVLDLNPKGIGSRKE